MFVLPNVLSPPAAVALSERYCYAACPLAMLLHCRRRRPASPSSRSKHNGFTEIVRGRGATRCKYGLSCKEADGNQTSACRQQIQWDLVAVVVGFCYNLFHRIP